MRRRSVKPVLVTGAGGFVGGAVALALAARGDNVVAVARPGRNSRDLPGVKVVSLDLAETESTEALVRKLSPSAIVHAAVRNAYSPEQGAAWLVRDNVLATANLVSAAAKEGIERFVQLGSFLEYGKSDDLLDESRALRPDNLRGATKAAATMIVLGHASSLPVVVLRLFTVYGPGERMHRLVPAAILASLEGAEFPLTAPGFHRDLVHIDDVVAAILASLDVPFEGLQSQVINIATGIESSNEDVVAAVEKVTGRTVRVKPDVFPSRPTDALRMRATVAKARELLGWSAQLSVEEGIARTVPWVREWIARR